MFLESKTKFVRIGKKMEVVACSGDYKRTLVADLGGLLLAVDVHARRGGVGLFVV